MTVSKSWTNAISSNCNVWLSKVLSKVNCHQCMAFFDYSKPYFCINNPCSEPTYWKSMHHMLVTKSRLIRQWRIKCAKRIMVSSHVDNISRGTISFERGELPISTLSLVSLLDNFCRLESTTLLSSADCRSSIHENHFPVPKFDKMIKFARVSHWKIFSPQSFEDLWRSRNTKGQMAEMKCLLSDLEALVHPSRDPKTALHCKNVFWYTARAKSAISTLNSAAAVSSDRWTAGSERSILVAIKFSDVVPYTYRVARVAALAKLRSDGLDFYCL